MVIRARSYQKRIPFYTNDIYPYNISKFQKVNFGHEIGFSKNKILVVYKICMGD